MTILKCYIPLSISDWAPVLSGVPRGTVLGPLLFSLYINEISTDTDSEIRLFADDCVCYREIKDTEDTLKLQKDVDQLGCWARKLDMRFQPVCVKCNMMQINIYDYFKMLYSFKHIGLGPVLSGVRQGTVLGLLLLQITRKQIKKIHASYTLGMVLKNVESIKYLGVTITNDL